MSDGRRRSARIAGNVKKEEKEGEKRKKQKDTDTADIEKKKAMTTTANRKRGKKVEKEQEEAKNGKTEEESGKTESSSDSSEEESSENEYIPEKVRKTTAKKKATKTENRKRKSSSSPGSSTASRPPPPISRPSSRVDSAPTNPRPGPSPLIARPPSSITPPGHSRYLPPSTTVHLGGPNVININLDYSNELYADHDEKCSVKMRELAYLAELLSRNRRKPISEEECVHAVNNTGRDEEREDTAEKTEENEEMSSESEDEWEEMEYFDERDKKTVEVVIEKKPKKKANVDWRIRWLRSEVNRRVKEKALNIHKAHFLCLLAHCRYIAKAALYEGFLPSLLLTQMPSGYGALVGHPMDEIHLGKILKWFCSAFKQSSVSFSVSSKSDHHIPELSRWEKMVEEKEFVSDEDRAVFLFALFASFECIVRLCFQFQIPVEGQKETAPSKKSKKNRNTWVEIWMESQEKWICIDPLKHELADEGDIEKETSAPIQYVFAVDNKLSVREIAFRYASAFLSPKFRRLRPVDDWIKETLKLPMFRSDHRRARLEDKEWHRLLEARPIPTSLIDLKNHPLYVLDSAMKKFEAIYPPDTEPVAVVRKHKVFLRSNLHQLQGSLNWIKFARSIKAGEEPYKTVKGRPKMSTGEAADLPLYGFWQTEEYVAPKIENGRLPRNEYGNLYMYKPSMCPTGAVHLRLPGLVAVSRQIDKDCVPAVVGWQCQGGHNVPIIDGAIVLAEDEAEFRSAFSRIHREQREREKKRREENVLRRWRKLIQGALRFNSVNRKFAMDTRPVEGETLGDDAQQWPQTQLSHPLFKEDEEKLAGGF